MPANPDSDSHPRRIGAIPGSLIRHHDAEESRVRLIRYSRAEHEDRFLENARDISEGLQLPDYQPRDRSVDESIVAIAAPAVAANAQQAEAGKQGVTWINVDGLADIDLLRALGKKYGLHALSLEDAVNVNQLAKTDVYDHNLYIVMRMPCDVAPFETEQLSIFLLNGLVLTFQEVAGDCLDSVRQRIARSKGRIRTRGADYLAYSIIDAVIDGYFPLLEKYDAILRSIGDEIEEDLSHEIPRKLHEIRADLLQVRKVAQQQQDALLMLMHEESPLVSDSTYPFLQDCLDHIKRLVDTSDTYRETCGELRELYFACLGQKTNDVMKVLTIIATIFIPMSFIAGIYGMNFDSSASPLNMPELH